MAENPLDKNGLAASESIHHSISGITKKVWQTPKLTEADYGVTKSGPGPSGDDGITYS